MTYQLVLTGRLKKGLKRAKKRGLDIALLDFVVEKLMYGLGLGERFRDHDLKGKYAGFRECHIPPDLPNSNKKINPTNLAIMWGFG